jgi:predicted DNA-binding protein (MmcQ/YjbR family)
LNRTLHSPLFDNKTPDFEKLKAFGFARQGEAYVYSHAIAEGQFILSVLIAADGEIRTRVADADSDDEYILHLTPDAAGTFVGRVRADYLNILRKIADECFETRIFKSDCAVQIIQYVREKYQNEFEFLWDKFPGNAIVRRPDNRKWYAVLLSVAKNKIGLSGTETVEIIDLRMAPEEVAAAVDGKRYFPGFHMNKKHWITICLDGSVPLEEICCRIDGSYRLAR